MKFKQCGRNMNVKSIRVRERDRDAHGNGGVHKR